MFVLADGITEDTHVSTCVSSVKAVKARFGLFISQDWLTAV